MFPRSVVTQTDYASIKEGLESLPEGENFSHSDFHPGNVLIQNEEPLLIDMATVGKGSPIMDIIAFGTPIVGSVYRYEDDDYVSVFNKLTKAQNLELYDAFLEGYLGTDDKEYLERPKSRFSLIL